MPGVGLEPTPGINQTGFFKQSGLKLKEMEKSAKNFNAWDKYRRDRLTLLVKTISKTVKKLAPSMQLSCAVISSIERSYVVNFQDWTNWLGDGLIDYAVAMNYTMDPGLFKIYSQSVLIDGFKDRIYIGVGAYLLNSDINTLEEELDIVKKLSPGGVVIFSYDDISKSGKLKTLINNLQTIR